jgi:large subunit ribosomal protein L9
MPRRKLENRTIEVILMESNKHLGERFEIVRVKPIFARNVLLPKNMAVLATADMVNKYSQKIKASEKERALKAEGFRGLLSNIEKDGGLVFTGKVNKDGTLYAKIDEADIAKLVKETYKLDVEDHFFKMKKKITTIGDFVVPFLYKDIKGDIAVKVNAENPEVIEKKEKVVVKEETPAEETKEEEKTEETAE